MQNISTMLFLHSGSFCFVFFADKSNILLFLSLSLISNCITKIFCLPLILTPINRIGWKSRFIWFFLLTILFVPQWKILFDPRMNSFLWIRSWLNDTVQIVITNLVLTDELIDRCLHGLLEMSQKTCRTNSNPNYFICLSLISSTNYFVFSIIFFCLLFSFFLQLVKQSFNVINQNQFWTI